MSHESFTLLRQLLNTAVWLSADASATALDGFGAGLGAL